MITDPKNDFEGMFGPYPIGHCFEIENSQILKAINKNAGKGEGIKIAEFLLLETATEQSTITISIIEAKTNSPQRFDDFINDVQEKLTNSLALFIAIYLNRHVYHHDELPERFRHVDLSIVKFRLILAVQKSEEAWLPPLQESLRKALKKTVKIWNLEAGAVIVLNEEGARQHGLIN